MAFLKAIVNKLITKKLIALQNSNNRLYENTNRNLQYLLLNDQNSH